MDRSSPPPLKGVRLFVWGVALGAALTVPVYLYFGQGLRNATGRVIAGESVEEGAPAKTDVRRKPIRKVPVKPDIVPDIIPPVLPDRPPGDESREGGEIVEVASAEEPNAFNWISVNQSDVYQTSKWQPVTVPLVIESRVAGKDQRPPSRFAKVIDGVIVPIPREIFVVMDKVGKQHWMATQRPLAEAAVPSGTQTQNAFFLGTLIAEGFIAVELQDVDQIKIIGQSITNYGANLGVRKAIIPRVAAIMVAAQKGRWLQVRLELDGALGSVRTGLMEMMSAELADIVALGGWARGTEAFCQALETNPSPVLGKFIFQQILVIAFQGQLRSLKTRLKQGSLVLNAANALEKVKPMMEPDITGHLFASAVKQIGQVATDFVAEIQTPPQATRSATSTRTSAL